MTQSQINEYDRLAAQALGVRLDAQALSVIRGIQNAAPKPQARFGCRDCEWYCTHWQDAEARILRRDETISALKTAVLSLVILAGLLATALIVRYQ